MPDKTRAKAADLFRSGPPLPNWIEYGSCAVVLGVLLFTRLPLLVEILIGIVYIVGMDLLRRAVARRTRT